MPRAPDRRRPIAIDFFAGAGGLALGFEQAGFDVVAAVELDPIHAAVHQLNFPETAVICRDIRSLSGAEVRELAGIGRAAIDVVIGGPPCQGFSLIGHRILDDPRNSLVFHFLRLVTELKPRAFVMENVPGMASGAHHQLLDELIERFREAKYRVRTPIGTLNAAEFGVPQNRRRLFLLGAREDMKLPSYPEPTSLGPNGNGHSAHGLPLFRAEGLERGTTVAEAIGDLPDIEEFDSLWTTDRLVHRLRGGSGFARTLRGELKDPGDFSYRRKGGEGELTGCLRAAHTAESRRRFAATRPGETEPISRFFRLPPDGLCNTLRAGTASDRGAFTSPRPIHPSRSRCISVREAARIHSYPDWFRFHRTIWHGFRQIGNSVPPLLGRAVATGIMKALGRKPVRPRRVLQLGDEALAHFNMKEAADHFRVDRKVIAQRRRRVVTTEIAVHG
ncbi:MAG: DNA cytosine methyltransferase [Gemmatimonadota bacterium]|nr:DNA cytosine methyltransferase [Gemmatimonadota bacterium]